MTGKPKIIGEKAAEKQRYIHVYLTPALDEMLERWKEATKQGYADTARQAIFEYLNPRLERMAPRSTTEHRAPAPMIAGPNPRQCRSEIITAAAAVLSPYLAAVPDITQSKTAKIQLEAVLVDRREAFEALGMDATMKNLISILDTEAGMDPRLVAQAIFVTTKHDRKK